MLPWKQLLRTMPLSRTISARARELDSTYRGPRERHLVLLTTSFPRGDNEPFVESELPYLAPHFDRITIVSDEMSEGRPPSSIPRHATSCSFQAQACQRDLFRLLHPRHVSALL